MDEGPTNGQADADGGREMKAVWQYIARTLMDQRISGRQHLMD
jgi:hypothetical protein